MLYEDNFNVIKRNYCTGKGCRRQQSWPSHPSKGQLDAVVQEEFCPIPMHVACMVCDACYMA